MNFLFLGALLALPLAGLPVVLHLMNRRRSPIVYFSTTRFIRSSMQRTAARRRLQKWLLLAARVLLLLLLILAAAQPAKKLASSLGGGSTAVAIVVDTSYSMTALQNQQTRLAVCDTIINGLLTDELRQANVALYKSLAADTDGQFASANDWLTRQTNLTPQPTTVPFLDRIATARRALEGQQAATKWLVILSDLQSREFPRQADAWPDGQTVVFDLHPTAIRSAGIVDVALNPPHPLPGVSTEAVITMTGRAGDSRGVTVTVATPDGTIISTSPAQVGRIDSAGQARVVVPLKLPARPLVVLSAALDGEDDLTWDNTRSLAIEMPRRRNVRVLASPTALSATLKRVTLALDPSEGRSPDWPLHVEVGPTVLATDEAVVAEVVDWADVARADALQQAAARGAVVLTLVRPGLQGVWEKASADQQKKWLPLLPGRPSVDRIADTPHHAIPPAAGGSLLKELLDERFALSAMTTQRLIPFDQRGDVTTLLAAAPKRDGGASGLLYRHTLGGGTVYTLATLPDPQFSTLATHPIFLPMLVRCCLTSVSGTNAANSIIGEPLRLVSPATHLILKTPGGENNRVERPPGANTFLFADTTEPGTYRWQDDAAADTAVAVVGYPAEEAALDYREVSSAISGQDVIVARNLEEFRTAVAQVTQPSPRWSPLIAIVLVLLCFEALVGNSARLWRLRSAGAPAPRTA